MTNPTRFSKQEDLDAMANDRHRFDNLSNVDQMHERLRQLQTFIRQLANTDQGRKDLQQRIALLGPCHSTADETPSVFYGRLRRWLDKDLTHHVRRGRREAMAEMETQRPA
jgi:hypothetical protein